MQHILICEWARFHSFIFWWSMFVCSLMFTWWNEIRSYWLVVIFCCTSTLVNIKEMEFLYSLPSCWTRSSLSSFLTCRSCRIVGRLVTMPVPLGRKSRPTKLSITELLPELCTHWSNSNIGHNFFHNWKKEQTKSKCKVYQYSLYLQNFFEVISLTQSTFTTEWLHKS